MIIDIEVIIIMTVIPRILNIYQFYEKQILASSSFKKIVCTRARIHARVSGTRYTERHEAPPTHTPVLPFSLFISAPPHSLPLHSISPSLLPPPSISPFPLIPSPYLSPYRSISRPHFLPPLSEVRTESHAHARGKARARERESERARERESERRKAGTEAQAHRHGQIR
jgi:hypothetical protein